MSLGLFPLSDHSHLVEQLSVLHRALSSNQYSEALRLPVAGGLKHLFFDVENVQRYARHELNLDEMSAVAPFIYRAFGRTHQNALELYKVFALNRSIGALKLNAIIGEKVVRQLLDAGMLVSQGDSIRSRVLAAPLGELTCFHDTFSMSEAEKFTHVFFGRCSVRLARSLAELSRTRRFTRSLDLCTGSGVQALLCSKFSDEVTGVDINPRAVRLAQANQEVNLVRNARFLESDLFSAVEGQFDLITANTPFLLLPPDSKATSGKGGELGIEVTLRIFEALDTYLRPEGFGRFVVSTAWVSGRSTLVDSLRTRLAGKGYRIRLVPINTYYDPNLFSLYESLGVQRCTLYVAEVERTGVTLEITEIKRSMPVELIYRATTALNRWQGSKRIGASARVRIPAPFEQPFR